MSSNILEEALSEGEENLNACFDGFPETLSLPDLQVIDEEDETLLATFMSENAGPQLTLADIVIQRIEENDAEAASEARPLPRLDTSIIDLFKRVGNLLSRYTNGRFPRALNLILNPRLPLQHWEDVLYLTEPENWSPNAMYQATRIFSSSLAVKKAQRFYSLVLLPRIREEIRKNKTLHPALYQSLKKSMHKPSAFNKGILFPLCQSGTCTLREAVMVGSIIEKVSIPPLDTSVALIKLTEMEPSGTTSYFVKLFLDKKYALPYRVLDAVVAHFMRFLGVKRIMPVIWHESLLAFVQRYKNTLTREDKNNLNHLIHHQKHYLVTPEIRRELMTSRNRGEKEDDLMPIASLSVISNTVEDNKWEHPKVPMEEN